MVHKIEVYADDESRHKRIPGTIVDPQPTTTGMSKSMHDGVEIWCDCCSCEAEPYWVEAMQDDDKKRLDKHAEVFNDDSM